MDISNDVQTHCKLLLEIILINQFVLQNFSEFYDRYVFARQLAVLTCQANFYNWEPRQ